MSLRRPLNVGSGPNELPEVTWEVMVGVPFRRGRTAGDLARLQEDLWTELEGVIRRVVSEGDADRLACAEIYPIRGRGRETPLFPMVAGGLRFTCAEDIAETVEQECAGTDLCSVMHDARGHAYEVSVELHFRREKSLDGVRVAPLVVANEDRTPPR